MVVQNFKEMVFTEFEKVTNILYHKQYEPAPNGFFRHAQAFTTHKQPYHKPS